MYHLHNHSYICIIIGSREEQLAVKPDVVEELQPEEPALEVQAEEDAGEELQECPDHRPSSFERGKPWSISLSVCNYLINALLKLMHYVQELIATVAILYLVYLCYIPCYPGIRSRVNA
jgi:hypothetical protein